MWWLWAEGEGAALQHVHVLHSIRACVPPPLVRRASKQC